MPSKLGFAVAIVAVVVSMSACSVGPKYVRPAVPVASSFKEGVDWKPSEPGDQLSRGKWWERFNDPDLNRLEETLNISNQNIAAAVANVQAARAIVRQSRAQYYPVVTANPSITTGRQPTAGGKTISTYTLPLEASWEPDLFGRVRNTVRSSVSAAQASAADLENVRLLAQAELATEYFELRTQDNLKQILDATVDSYREALSVAQARSAAGLDSDESVGQAETQLKTTQAQDTNVGVLRAQFEHAIAVLTGQSPETFGIPRQVVKLNLPSVPLGIPSELLERRPDVAAAERAVAQANAQIGVAKSAFFPSLLLSATLGLQNTSASQLLDWRSRLWSAAPSVAQTIFDAGSRRAVVQQSQASYEATVANYRQTVLAAFQQVEDNLAAVRILEEVIQEQDSGVNSALRTLGEANVRYTSGVDPYLNVITAQTALLNAQESALTFRQQQMIASVQLINALGGGWEVSQIR